MRLQRRSLPGHLSLIVAAGLMVAVGIAAGCTRSSTTASTDSTVPAAGQLTASDPAVLSQAEIKYGASPKPDSHVTYQSNVIVMEHGAEAIRSQSRDGFTWSIDASAPGASQIQPDKILFATGRVVGRVLKVERKGPDFDVTLGPVELTDIFEEAHISSQGALDPAKMVVYVAPAGYPGTFMDRDAPEPSAAQTARMPGSDSGVRVYTVSGTGELIPVDPALEIPHGRPCRQIVEQQFHAVLTNYVASDMQSRLNDGCVHSEGDSSAREFYTTASASSTAADIQSVLIGGFSFTPNLSRGLEVAANYDQDGVKFQAHVNISLSQPKFTFRLDISHGLKTAAVELEGVGGIDVGIKGGTGGKFKNVNQVFAVPIDISFPIAGPIPFAATFHQSFLVQTMFTGEQGVIIANGAYSIGGKITAGIVNGKATGTAPLFIKTNQNMAYSLTGVSANVNGLVLAYGGKLIVGLGAFGLVAGPYASLNTVVGITRGSDLQTALVAYTCRSAKLEIFLDYGVGFAIPSWSAKIINTFLGMFHAKPISTTYDTPLGTLPITKLYDASPPSCADKPAS